MLFSLFLCLVILGMCCGAYERDSHARAEVKSMSPLGGIANHTRLKTWNNTKPAVLHSLLWLSASSFLAFFKCIYSPALRMDHEVGWFEARKHRTYQASLIHSLQIENGVPNFWQGYCSHIPGILQALIGFRRFQLESECQIYRFRAT